MIKTTLCIIHTDDKILLGMKKRGFGVNRWNGFGGKLQRGEDPKSAAIREVKEEIGITIDPKQRGFMHFIDEADEDMDVYLFSADKYSGAIVESDEMLPKWFELKDIPYDFMWPDDKYWLPIILSGKNVLAEFHFDGPDIILDKDVKATN